MNTTDIKGEFNDINADGEKKVIIDLLNRLKYEVSEEQLAILAGTAHPLGDEEFVDWRAKIDGLDLKATRGSWLNSKHVKQLREILRRLVDAVREIGGKVVDVGRRLIKWIFSLLQRYPTTMAAAVIMAVLCFVIGTVPWVGKFLFPFAKLASACIVFLVFLNEWSTTLRCRLAAKEAN